MSTNLSTMLAAAPQVLAGEESAPHQLQQAAPVTSGTALELDQWDLNRGSEILERSEPLRKALGAFAEHTDEDYHIKCAADFYAAAYKPQPAVCEHPDASIASRAQFMQALLETPEYRSLHESTCLNQMASEMASVEFSGQFVAMVEKEGARKEAYEKKHGKQPDPNDPKEQMRQEMAALRAANKAVKAAQKEVDDTAEACKAMGLGQGDAGRPLSLSTVGPLFERIKNNARLRAIFNLSGRYRRVAQSRQQSKQIHGYEDMVGITLDDNLATLLSEELAMLCDEDMELDAMRRLLEKESLAAEYRGSEHIAKGPVVICVDESGSMQGQPIANAKAIALAMAWIARHQKRWCALVGYSGGTEGTLCVLPPGMNSDAELLDWLEHFYGGGTPMDVPLAELPGKYWGMMNAPKGKTDLILITDAIVNVPSTMRDTFLKWKAAEKVRCISLVIGDRAGDLGQVSDEVHLLNNLNTSEAGVLSCLSI